MLKNIEAGLANETELSASSLILLLPLKQEHG